MFHRVRHLLGPLDTNDGADEHSDSDSEGCAKLASIADDGTDGDTVDTTTATTAGLRGLDDLVFGHTEALARLRPPVRTPAPIGTFERVFGHRGPALAPRSTAWRRLFLGAADDESDAEGSCTSSSEQAERLGALERELDAAYGGLLGRVAGRG